MRCGFCGTKSGVTAKKCPSCGCEFTTIGDVILRAIGIAAAFGGVLLLMFVLEALSKS